MDPASKFHNILDAAFGYGPALKVSVGCIARYTPEGHVYHLSLQCLQAPSPQCCLQASQSSCRDTGPHINKKSYVRFFKNELSNCKQL